MTDYKYPIHIMRVETTNPRLTWCGMVKPSKQTEWENIDAAIAPSGSKPEPCLHCLMAIRAKLHEIVEHRMTDEEGSTEYKVDIHMITHDAGNNSLIHADCTVNGLAIGSVEVYWRDDISSTTRRAAIEEVAIRKYQELTRIIE